MLPFSSSFVGADGTLLTDFNPAFQNVSNYMQIQSNLACPSGEGGGLQDCVAVNEVFDNAQYAEIVCGTIAGGVFAGVAILAQAAASESFISLIGNESISYFGKWVAGIYTGFGTGSGWAPGDVVRLEAESGVITPLLNGLADIAPAVDVTFVSGRGALSGYSNGAFDSGVDSFETGNLHVPPAGSAGVLMPLFVPGI